MVWPLAAERAVVDDYQVAIDHTEAQLLEALVRRLLVETAWHYQHRPSVGVALTWSEALMPAS